MSPLTIQYKSLSAGLVLIHRLELDIGSEFKLLAACCTSNHSVCLPSCCINPGIWDMITASGIASSDRNMCPVSLALPAVFCLPDLSPLLSVSEIVVWCYLDCRGVIMGFPFGFWFVRAPCSVTR